MKKFMKVVLAVVAINVVANVVARLIRAKKAEWEGLTESQVRDKLDAKLGDRMPEEKRSAMADKVVAGMRSRDMLADESERSPGETPTE